MSVETINSWSMTLVNVAGAILWQSALLAGVAAGVCWLLRRSSPVVRYWCWQIVALKLLLMPWWILAIPLPALVADTRSLAVAPVSAPIDGAAPDVVQSGTLLEPQHGRTAPSTTEESHRVVRLSWQSWLVLAWLCGVTCLAGRIVIQGRRMQHLLARASPATEPRLLAMVEHAAGQLGLRRRPRVVLTDQDASPFVCGMFRPMLVLPRSLLGTLDAVGWRQVLLHELAHIKRHDLWWGWLPEIARLIYFFHPVAHWVCWRIRLERELACDQQAMALGGGTAADYAVVLVQVVSHASTPPALQAAAASICGPGLQARPKNGPGEPSYCLAKQEYPK